MTCEAVVDLGGATKYSDKAGVVQQPYIATRSYRFKCALDIGSEASLIHAL